MAECGLRATASSWLFLALLGWFRRCPQTSYGASRTRCGGEFQPPYLRDTGVGTLLTLPAAEPLPVSSTLTAFGFPHSSRPYLDRLSMPSSCTSQAPSIPLRSGMGSGKRCQAVARTLEPPHSTHPTTRKHRDHLPCTLCSPLTRTAACRLADSSGASGGCGCDGKFDIPNLSSALKSGCPVRSAQEAGTSRKTHSLGTPRAVRASRTIV